MILTRFSHVRCLVGTQPELYSMGTRIAHSYHSVMRFSSILPGSRDDDCLTKVLRENLTAIFLGDIYTWSSGTRSDWRSLMSDSSRLLNWRPSRNVHDRIAKCLTGLTLLAWIAIQIRKLWATYSINMASSMITLAPLPPVDACKMRHPKCTLETVCVKANLFTFSDEVSR